MQKLIVTFLVLFSFFTEGRSQTPFFIDDINDYVTVYDSTELQNLPLLNIGILTFSGGIDTNFIGIVEPQKKFRKLLDYPYPNDTLIGDFDDLFILNSVNNSNFWTSPEINSDVDVPLQPTGFESIYTFDSALNLNNTVTLNIPHTYTYHGTQYNATILFDVHDHNAFELNGRVYVLAIGTHLEWYDASGSWIDEDSMRVRFTTLHILDAATNTEVARWEPQNQGYTLENFGLPIHLQTLPSGLKMYSHPHINVIEPHAEGDAGVYLYASARHPGIINKLYWDGVSNTISPQWMFGNPPRFTTPLYLETITSNQLDACHGASAFVNGDTTYMATYNNKPSVDSIGGRHQVWRVYTDTAELIWQTPDIGVSTICKGYAKWSDDGRYVLTTHGNCDGATVTEELQGNTIVSSDYEKFQILNPWTNTKVAGIYLTGSVYVGLMQFVDDDKILSFQPIEVEISDSIKFTHSNPGFVFWTIGNVKYYTPELKLPLTYSDSLDEISAWIKTGYTGAWRVDEKDISFITAISQRLNSTVTFSTIQNIENYTLPEGYNWVAYDIFGSNISTKEINEPGLYVIEGYNQQNTLVYRKKHVFIR